jgi:hypothetical protein
MAKNHRPGVIALIGSGETTRFGGQVFDRLIRQYPPGGRICVLETPAGFELNSPAVAGRVADYLRTRLKNYLPEIQVIPARARGTTLNPDNPDVLQPLTAADLIFMGPGSPSYAVRQLEGSLAWALIRDRYWQGASLGLASAAAIAFGRYALPIYEIYKVGEDPHWKNGLDFFGSIGLELAVIPHWNNHDGGAELDTSCCFMGARRFQQLMDRLPKSVTVVGIDEMTTLVIDLAGECCDVMGTGQVRIIGNNRERVFGSKTSFGLTELGDVQDAAVATQLAKFPDQEVKVKGSQYDSGDLSAPPEVQELILERERARDRKDWAAADQYRLKIESLGWQVTDTSEGPRLSIKKT